MAVPKRKSPGQATASLPGRPPLTPQEFGRQFSKLVRRWKKHHKDDLVLRLKTGQLLNLRYGEPNRRQCRGDCVIAEDARKLGLHVSEVSRMRWFAYRFPSVEELWEKHPKATKWTQVRNLLVRKSSGSRAKNRPLLVAGHHLVAATRAVQRFPDTASEDERAKLREQVQELLKVLPPWLQAELSPRAASRRPAA